MPSATNAKPKRRAKRLYHAAKISDYAFKKVLGHFRARRLSSQFAHDND